ncbi:MAG: helix-turn-helix domain-containing protein [Dehalococcoidia bacterium]
MDEVQTGIHDDISQDRQFDLAFLADLQRDLTALGVRYRSDATIDIAFLAYLRRMARFGYFSYGPVTIDVRVIEDIVERTTVANAVPGGDFYPVYAEDYVRFTRVLMDELRKSGQRRVDELHFLLALMRCGEGLPSRVFGELGVTPEQVEEYARGRQRGEDRMEKLYSPEEVAEYLGVHVQTVRTWIRTGKLPARRLAGQRALRVRASDIQGVLEPIEPGTDGERRPGLEGQ